eukprot:TRINITY_DN2235_c0_g1_i1.p1 TRINITY_DN2235_c0_g1~~TRINITY_DN2235_c0_g1_i1.p1  ORF type:complete len:1083 (+),score=440.34 TRINITY_DN2235_c0_g1_i1:121-3249(+)
MDRPRAVVRLMRDLKELKEHPVPNANAAPLEDDLFTWHINVVGRSGEFNGVHFHLVMKFTEEYPMVPPKVDLFTTIPHPNVFPNKNQCKNHVCLDMLETPDFAGAEFKDRAFAGWSSSYTVSSILSQLASFLMEENLQYASHKITPAGAANLAKKFECESCPHKGTKPWPVVESNKKEVAKKRMVNIPQLQFARQLATFNAPKAAPQASKPDASSPAVKTAVQPVKTEEKPAVQPKPVKKSEEDEWEVVTNKKNKNKKGKNGKKENPLLSYAKKEAALELERKKKEREEEEAKKKALEDERLAKEAAKKQFYAEKHKKFLLLSEEEKKAVLKKQKKNQKRAQERARKAAKGTSPKPLESDAKEPAKKAPVEAPKSGSSAPSKASKQEESEGEDDGFEEVASKKGGKHEEEEEDEMISAYAAKKKREEASMTGDFIVDPKKSYKKGNFDVLPWQMLIEIFALLPLRDVFTLSTTCKGIYQVTQDGLLWKGLFSKYYPNSSLNPQNMSDWKSLFVLEVDHILDELVCFHTKSTFEEDVLGFPIVFTVNPKTKEIDYIDSSMDLLSREAFFVDKIRKTVWKEKFTDWLPLYIDEDHFERALPLLQKSLLKMTGKANFPDAVMDFFPKFMNTMVVLLMDKGVHASQKTLDGYFAVHRLFIELVQRFPVIKERVEEIVRNFAKKPETRVKSSLPSLGNFLALLSVSEKFSWGNVAQAYLEETFDRNVIWIGKQHPALVSGNPTKGTGVELDRLSKSFEASKVSCRLNMFHVHFLLLNRGKSLDAIAAQYDLFFGRPSHKARSDFQTAVKKIIEVNNWPGYFYTVGIKVPNPATVTDWLKDAIAGSKRKGYHSARTNFSAIQASGVSSILKKGESYKASAHLKNVRMYETWGFPTHTIFLDASCLSYDFEGKFISVCDFARTTALDGAVRHSGDVIDNEKKCGTHTIDIKLDQLPKNVKALYFTMTAYTTVLTNIKQPYVRFTEEPGDIELCRYDLEKGNTGNNTCVIMCKLERDSPTGTWSVHAIGHIGMGRASDYEPIKTSIKQLK